jgi:hypothetical protein
VRPHHFSVVFEDVRAHHCTHNPVIELPSRVFQELIEHGREWESLPVRAIRQHSIDGVAKDDNLGSDGDFVS